MCGVCMYAFYKLRNLNLKIKIMIPCEIFNQKSFPRNICSKCFPKFRTNVRWSSLENGHLEQATFFIRVFFTDTNNSQDSRGREGTIFYSSLPLPPVHEHSDIHLQLCMWDDYHIFNCIACIYQAATQWDLPPYRITISLIDDVTLSFCLFTGWLDSSFFLLQQFETENRWIRTRIDYHPYITSETTNQVC